VPDTSVADEVVDTTQAIDAETLKLFERFGIAPFNLNDSLKSEVLKGLQFGPRTLDVMAKLAESDVTFSFLPAEKLNELCVYSQKEGGYQREMAQTKVKRIAVLASMGLTFPPILVAKIRVRGQTHLYIIDGHHRTCGCVVAGAGLHALVVSCDLDELARFLYLIHNTTATKAGAASQRESSGGPQAAAERRLRETYGASGQQIMRLVSGIAHGNAVKTNYVSLDYCITPEQQELAETVLDIWTDSGLWREASALPKTCEMSTEQRYSSIGVMQVLGMMAQDRRDDHAKLKEEVEMFKRMSWQKNTKLAKVMGSGQDQVRKMKTYVDTVVLKGRAPDGRPSDHTKTAASNREVRAARSAGARI